MLPEFDAEDMMGKPCRVVRPAAKAEATPAAALLSVLRQIPPLLNALLQRETTVKVTPTINLPPAQVTVQMPPRPARTVECHFERDADGRIQSPITFTICEP